MGWPSGLRENRFDKGLRKNEFNPWWPPTSNLISYEFL